MLVIFGISDAEFPYIVLCVLGFIIGIFSFAVGDSLGIKLHKYLEKRFHKKLDKKIRKRKFASHDVEFAGIDIMNHEQFKFYIKALLEDITFTDVRLNPLAEAKYEDLTAKYQGNSYAICSLNTEYLIDIYDVNRVLDAKTNLNLDAAIVITTSSFTYDAISLAKENGVILWNREELTRLTDFRRKNYGNATQISMYPLV